MTVTSEHRFSTETPVTRSGRPNEAQENLLKLFDVVGAGDPNGNIARKRLFVRRKAGRSLELAQVVDGDVQYINIQAADLVNIIEADEWDGGVVEGVVDGWWRTSELHTPVTGVISDEDDEARAREVVSVVQDIDFDRVKTHQLTPQVEISQETGKGDTHSIFVTKYDLARAVVVAQLRPMIKRLISDISDCTEPNPRRSKKVISAIREHGVVGLFGNSRLKEIAMDVSTPGRVSTLLTVLLLSAVATVLALIRIQLFGIAGLNQQLVIVGQHVGSAASTIFLGLATVSVLKSL